MKIRVPRWVQLSITAFTALMFGLAFVWWLFLRELFFDHHEARCKEHKTFNRVQWNDPQLTFGKVQIRGCMVDDLLARHDLHGSSRAHVLGLLGPPPKTGYFSEYDLVYYLGDERGFMSIDSEWLVFRLDSAGRVADYRLVTD